MTTLLFANNASGQLAVALSSGATQLTLQSGQGALFPSPGVDELFKVTIENILTGDREITHCTSRSGDVLTITRAQEGTSETAFTDLANTVVQSRVTAGVLESLQIAGGVSSLAELTDVTLYTPDAGDMLIWDGYSWVSSPQPLIIQLACSDLVIDLETGTDRGYFRAPRAFQLLEVRASLLQPSSSGHVTVGINKNGASILYPDITIDQGERSSTTAATAAIITDALIGDDDEITVDIITAGTSAKGLVVTLIGT